jgi:Ca2+-binding EF-hand superfamily protein
MNSAKSWFSAVPAVALAATLASVQPALAQDAGAAAGAQGITMDQFVARQSARIMAADTDGDGRVSRAEFAALASMRAGKAGRDPERLFDAMDSNHDGYLDKDEIRSVLEKRFRRMDLNGDGILTPEERMAGRPRRNQPEPASMAPASQP